MPIGFDVSQFHGVTQTNQSYNTGDKLSKVRRYILNAASDPEFGDLNRQKLGYSISEMLIYCSFNREYCGDLNEEFVWYYSFTYGNCFTFNSGFLYNNKTLTKSPKSVKIVKKIGYPNQLNLELFTGARENKYSLEHYGAIVFIHNQTTKPESMGGILLKPGSKSNIHIRKNFNSLSPSPHSECKDFSSHSFDKTLYNVLKDESIEYTQQNCLDLCMQQEITAKCRCYYLEYLKLNQSYPCLTYDDLKCVDDVYDLFLENDLSPKCQSQCPLECKSLRYEFSVSTISYPSDSYAETLKTFRTVSDHYN